MFVYCQNYLMFKNCLEVNFSKLPENARPLWIDISPIDTLSLPGMVPLGI